MPVQIKQQTEHVVNVATPADVAAAEAAANVRLTSLETALADLQLRVTVLENATPPPPSGKAVITWAEIAAGFTAAHAVPSADVGQNRFGYGVGIHCQREDGRVLMYGHPYYPHARHLEFPQAPGMMAVNGDWMDVRGPTPVAGVDWQLGGLIELDNEINVACYDSYNGSGIDRPSFGPAGQGCAAYGDHHNAFIAGDMGHPPSTVAANFLSGGSGYSGTAINRWGPNLFAVTKGAPDYTTVPLLMHQSDHVLDGWWIGDRATSVCWIDTPTRHGVLALGRRGLSGHGYKADNDPFLGNGGYTATSYEAFAWIYDPADLLQVLAGNLMPWEPRPVEQVQLIYGDSLGVTHHTVIGTGTPVSELHASWKNGRLLISQGGAHQANPYERTPMIYSFSL